MDGQLTLWYRTLNCFTDMPLLKMFRWGSNRDVSSAVSPGTVDYGERRCGKQLCTRPLYDRKGDHWFSVGPRPKTCKQYPIPFVQLLLHYVYRPSFFRRTSVQVFRDSSFFTRLVAELDRVLRHCWWSVCRSTTERDQSLSLQSTQHHK